MNSTLKSSLKLSLHLGIIVSIATVGLLSFFYIYLPSTTNHGDTITVPDLKGMQENELDAFLSKKDLRYEIKPDSGFSVEFKPLAVLKQHPKPGSKVKKNRKIYLNLNAQTPPKTKMPNLRDESLKNAEMILKSYGLRRGKIMYRPDLAENAVLQQLYKGERIETGAELPKGVRIDLVVGDGLGDNTFKVMDFTFMPYDEALVAIQGSDLKVGSIINVSKEDSLTGMVIKQNPRANSETRMGNTVDLWVVNYDEIKNEN